MRLATTRTGFTPTSPVIQPKKKFFTFFPLKGTTSRSELMRAGRYTNNFLSKNWKLLSVLAVIVLVVLAYWSSYVRSHLIWIILLILLLIFGINAAIQGKVGAALILFVLAALSFFLLITGSWAGVWEALMIYYESLLPGIPFWLFISTLILGYIAYSKGYKENKFGVVVLIVILIMVLWIFVQGDYYDELKSSKFGSGVQNIESFFTTLGDIITEPGGIKDIQRRFEFRSPNVEEKEPKKGVKIEKFESMSSSYFQSESVGLFGRIHIDAIKRPDGGTAEDVKISLYCELEEDEKTKQRGKIIVYGFDEEFKDESKLLVTRDRDYDIECRFPDGFKIDDRDKTSETKKINLVVIYPNFLTKSTLPVYVVSISKLDESPEIIDDLELKLGSGRRAMAICTHGCALSMVGLSTSPQPLTDATLHRLGIRLIQESDGYYGGVKMINNLKLNLPRRFSLITKDCDLDKDKLQIKLDKYNKELMKKNSNIILDFVCNFKIDSVTDELEKSLIIVEAEYDYEVIGRANVKVYKE